eukprot:6635475-Alexandrium_andersonii.AAC.1
MLLDPTTIWHGLGVVLHGAFGAGGGVAAAAGVLTVIASVPVAMMQQVVLSSTLAPSSEMCTSATSTSRHRAAACLTDKAVSVGSTSMVNTLSGSNGSSRARSKTSPLAILGDAAVLYLSKNCCCCCCDG